MRIGSDFPAETVHYCDGSPKSLFRPCRCDGSIRYVHAACLDQWISRKRTTHCEVCTYPIQFEQVVQGSTGQNFSFWNLVVILTSSFASNLAYVIFEFVPMSPLQTTCAAGSFRLVSQNDLSAAFVSFYGVFLSHRFGELFCRFSLTLFGTCRLSLALLMLLLTPPHTHSLLSYFSSDFS
jgi:hypothetical protein